MSTNSWPLLLRQGRKCDKVTNKVDISVMTLILTGMYVGHLQHCRVIISYQLASAGTNNNDDYFSILPKLMTLRSTQQL